MLGLGLKRGSRLTPFGYFAAIAAVGVLAPKRAEAHFRLLTPDNWAQENNTLGGPQKSYPCGETDDPSPPNEVTPTNKVTPYHPGDTVTVTIQETVMHPGHYRVALSVNDRSELPADPPVTAAATACGTTVIEATPTFPVLVDGALQHTAALTGQQTIKVTLPTNVTCTHCTLQVIEFMSDHGLNNPGGCFYHHCADISIQSGDGGTSSPDAGHDAMSSATTGGVDASATGGRTTSSSSSSTGSASTTGASTGGGGSTTGEGITTSNGGGSASAGSDNTTSGSSSNGTEGTTGADGTTGSNTGRGVANGGAGASSASNAASSDGGASSAGSADTNQGSSDSGCSIGASRGTAPRPGTWALVAFGTAMAVLRRRRRPSSRARLPR
jgi:hypothetical protein